MQPRQIYASSMTRRERRWTRRRARRGLLNLALMTAGALVAAMSVLAVVVPGVA